jgi:type IV fimbrial biogenesis protein FimT
VNTVSLREMGHGFTLIELLVSMSVMSVLAAVAVPQLSVLGESAQMRALNNDLLVHLRLARSEAILRGGRVVVCTASSSTACSASAGWHQGWLVFVDANNNGVREVNEVPIRYRSAAPSDWSIKGNNSVTRYVSYDGMGSTRMVSGAFQAGTITICRSGSSRSIPREVVINSLGRIRSQDNPVAVCS